ncbi:DUF5360 family protein [Paenibacillus sp. 481]|uniref:DUF5360 family protein n=1 Tax=Paenibacillus sp. 481 TaxID=2835869 RepID=UPI001E2CF2B5|nr:DUF5360 family protein [Paenibacillus sp. 481]UHA72207.1 DUF5360 family protein [Paenibacillus sp. 481]
MIRAMRALFWITDIFFIVYWLMTALSLFPPEVVYNDYTNPILVAWNWSFMPLDLLISATGFYSLWLQRKQQELWKPWALISLVLTSCSGLQAIAYWSLRLEFDPFWWGLNLYLLIYPLIFIPWLVRKSVARTV